MKNFGLIVTLVLLAACNGGGSSGGNSGSKKSEPVVTKPEEKPVEKPEELPEVVNNTDAEIIIDVASKTLKVFQAKEKLTIEWGGWPTTHLGFCEEMKYHLKQIDFWKKQVSDKESKIKQYKARLAELELSPAENQVKITEYKSLIETTEKKRDEYQAETKEMQKNFDDEFNQNGGVGKVSWSGKWMSNLEKIAEDNKAWNVENYPLPKAEFKAIGLEMLPADKMIQDLSRIGFEVVEGSLRPTQYYQGTMTAPLSLYGACPLVSTADIGVPKPENKKIEIDVTFTK